MKVVLAGGGTGGHVYPALAMGAALRARGHTVEYAGAADRLEGRVAADHGYTFHPVEAPQYPRAGIVAKASFALSLLAAIFRARRMLSKIRPDLVLGVGGYIMAPTVLAARTCGVGRAIHESNVAPGMANRLCAKVADFILLSYAQTYPKLGTDAPYEVVGCPVNPKVLEGDRSAARKRYGLDLEQPVLLIVGGSLGAATINELALTAARTPDRPWQVLWITGPRYHEQALADLGEIGPGVSVVDYENKMGDAYAAADLAVCRAGSSTLAELTAVGLPALLIPSPNVTENHQEANARGLEELGAARVVTETELDLVRTIGEITELLGAPDRLSSMSDASRRAGRLDVADHVADLLEAQFGRP